MTEANDNLNVPIGPGTGLSLAILRRAALMLLLISAPAFLVTLQLRRHDLREANSAARLRQNIGELRGIATPPWGDCMAAPESAPALLRAAALNGVLPSVGDQGLAVLLSSPHAMAAKQAMQATHDPCGGA